MSSFFDQSSLCLIPSGYKDSKLYSVKPTDGSGDLTFSRGADVEATRVNSQGLIEKAKVNVLLQSNTFNTTWLNQLGGTITGGQSGYDGTNDAWLLSKDTSTFRSIRQVISFAGVVTYSAYVKAGTLSNVALRIDSSAGALQAKYDLSTGTTDGIGGSYIEYGIDSIGSGWYRIFVTANISGGTNVHVYVDRDGTTAGNIYVQDAQLNYGLVAQTYQETTTAAVVSGITNDMPRLNYDPANPTCPSLLLEPSRQNLLTNDTYFGGSDWSKIGVSPSANNATSPEGVTNAVLLSETAINDQHSLYPTISVTSGNAYTASCFVKQGTGSAAPQYIGFRFRGGGFTDAGGLVVDLVNKVATYEAGSLTGYKIEDYGNGWLRVSITQSATVTSSSAGLVLFFNNNISGSYSTDYLGNVKADMLVYGMQIELGSYPSSLIPTYGSSATRTADACSKTGISSLIGQTEGTALLDFQFNGATESIILDIAASGLSPQNRIILYQPSGGIVQFIILDNDVAQVNLASSSYSIGQRLKVAIAYKANDFAFYINGIQIGTDNSGSVPATSRIDIGNRQDAGFPATISVNQALLFKTRLSNADLATLTSL